MVNPPDTLSEESTSERTRWFAEEVYPHDASLRSYVAGSFPAVREEVNDVVQESYLRIWKARAAQPILSARAFLFRIARNVALDLVRHHQASPIDSGSRLEGLTIIEDGLNVAEAAGRQERIRLLADAIAGLPRRCREVFILHKIKGYSRKEVADQLGLSDRTVGVQTERAVRRCADYMRRRGVNGHFYDEAR